MKIVPTRIRAIVDKKVSQHKNGKMAKDCLSDLYGKSFNHISLSKNKDGSVTAYGHKVKEAPYSRTYSILPNGEHVQTLVSRKQEKNGNFIEDLMRLVMKPDGSSTVESYTIKRNEFGDILETSKNSEGSFKIVPKRAELIDITELLRSRR